MFSKIGVIVPDICLPQNVSYEAWSVIACDQFTQDRAYWEGVEEFVGENPSAYRVVLPEIDLHLVKERIPQIHRAMEEYMSRVLTRGFHGVALTRRTTERMTRHGVVLAVDLERYDYSANSTSLIRATEGTIIERLPPRVAIREGAQLESPHILLLIDDPECTVVEPLFESTEDLSPLYDFSLMMNGGRAEGWAITDENRLASLARSLSRLADPERQKALYGDAYKGAPLLFAVGDGNHSLAAAKALWEKLKSKLPPADAERHPARYALVEVGNLHDPGLIFEPIHRVLFGVNPEEATRDFASYLKENTGSGGYQTFSALSIEGSSDIFTADAPHALLTGSIQGWLDSYLAAHPSASLDYIHGEDEVRRLAAQEGALGFLLPVMDKAELFASVMRDGPLPRKAFSMGEARDKRYYLECRSLRG